ncbi:S8 family peptidase [Longimicrobium sp.]|uniref:S8 family peptidase n=1 Tax=Longimicrobium sp. TaxID=2029185 RepID=UPI003B3BAC2D
MKTSGIVLTACAALSLAACADRSPVAARAPDAAPLHAAARGIDGQYVVVLNQGADPRSVAAAAGVSPRHVYTASLVGFSAALNAGQLNALRHNPNVAYVEQDQQVRAAATQTGATWGLDRIDQAGLPLSGTYTYTATASNVNVYIIDTGIHVTHPQFGARATNVYDALGGTGADCHGHGTHVTGIIGSTTFGIAKGARLRGVRVLDCTGTGTVSGLIAAIDWVRLNHQPPAVAVIAVSVPYSAAVNAAATSLVNAGVFTAAAAGNNNANACNYSPGSAPAVMTTMASTSTDARASYSNYGSCTDLYAPGTGITSTWLNGGTSTLSGTSMAAAHVAGVAALYKSINTSASPATMTTWIISNAIPNVITGNPAGTPNRLLNKNVL